MKKIILYMLVSIAVTFGSVGIVKASDDGTFNITSEAAFDECLREQSSCRLMSDLELTMPKTITKELVLNLNGHSLFADENLNLKSGLLVIERGGKLTINDSKNTGVISTGDKGNVWAAIQVLKTSTGSDLAELTINGGTIEGYYYGITGNGNNPNTKITINDGTIKGLNKEDSVGIYQPQMGDLYINGGSIEGGTGVEIRSGNLTVNDGTIKAIAPEFIKMVNTNGTTTNGVGISIAQHTTKKPINVIVNNGIIEGQYALYEWNPHNHSTEELNYVTLHIYGGSFNGLATGVHAIYSEDFTGFVHGGKFNTDVSEYLAEDAKLALKTANDRIVMNKESNDNVTKIVLVSLILICLAVSLLICKKKKILFFN